MLKSARTLLNTRLIKCFRWRNVIRALMADQPADWKSFLRTYFEEGKVVLRIGEMTFTHGAKLQKDSNRLVYTPLTEKAYHFLCEARTAFRTSGIHGPAGTGKSETACMLCQDLGEEVIRITSSDEIKLEHLVLHHKGWAVTGCTLLYDEYNRISIEVMEEAIKLIHELLNAMKDNKAEAKFGSHAFNIKQGQRHAWVATMNPNYAGRTPLPEVHKSEGRIIEFTVPDLNDILSISLATEGIEMAEKLGPMIVNISKDAKENLSK